MAKKIEEKIQTELIYGVHPILELLKAKRRRLIKIYTTKPEPKAWSLIAPLIPSYVTIQYVPRQNLTNLVQSTDHQGFVALAQPYSYRKKMFEAAKQPFLLMLDGIQDVRNLGAIIRSAYCAGVNGIIITKKNSVPLNAAAYKASAGLAEHMEILQVNSAKAGVIDLKAAGYTFYLATVEKSVSALDASYKEPLCLVIGSEGTGISPDILSAGEHVTLPQRRADISYNASVAAGILLFLIATKNKKI